MNSIDGLRTIRNMNYALGSGNDKDLSREHRFSDSENYKSSRECKGDVMAGLKYTQKTRKVTVSPVISEKSNK